MSISDFDILNKLGEGAFAQVFRVRRRADGKIYAMKQIRFGRLKQKDQQNALNEIRILASFNHPNIIAYKDSFID